MNRTPTQAQLPISLDVPGQPVVIVAFTDNFANDADLKLLRELEELREARLYHSTVTDGGLKELASLESLQKLDLSQTALTGSGFEHLKDLKSLKELILTESKLTGNRSPQRHQTRAGLTGAMGGHGGGRELQGVGGLQAAGLDHGQNAFDELATGFAVAAGTCR